MDLFFICIHKLLILLSLFYENLKFGDIYPYLPLFLSGIILQMKFKFQKYRLLGISTMRPYLSLQLRGLEVFAAWY